VVRVQIVDEFPALHNGTSVIKPESQRSFSQDASLLYFKQFLSELLNDNYFECWQFIFVFHKHFCMSSKASSNIEDILPALELLVCKLNKTNTACAFSAQYCLYYFDGCYTDGGLLTEAICSCS